MEFAIQVGDSQVRRDKPGIEGIIEQAVLAEKLGFSTVFVPDHYVAESLGRLQTETPLYELFFVMATLAQRTTTIRIGSHVACMLFRHPAMHARSFAQIDEASGGRVIAGVGAGWTRAEFEMMGIDFPDVSERLRMMDEAVTVMRSLWKDEPVSFDGRYYRLHDAVCLPKPLQKPGPPIMLGGSGNGILRRAGQWADIIHMVPVIGAAGTTKMEEVAKFSDASLHEKLARVRAAEQKAGRAKGSVRFASTVFSYAMTRTEDETNQLAEPLAKMFGLSLQDLLRHPVSLIGTAEQIVEELRRREATHGLSLLAINFANSEQLTEFGERVIAKM
jgi:probable F420-dependent oxidoreductase